MTPIVRVALLSAIVSLTVSQALAGAWTQEAGKGQLIVTTLYYATDTLYDNSGAKQAQPDYSKYEVSPYFEYGLADGLTVGANLSLQHATQDGTPGNPTLTNWGLGDSEFFARLRLLQKGALVVSVEPMVKLPTAEEDQPALGGRHADAGLGLLAGYQFSYAGLDHFIDLGLSYRYRDGTPEDQIKLSATAGFGLTKDLMLMSQAFWTLRADTQSTPAFTQSSNDDYNLLKLQMSLVYKLSESLSVQAGAFSHLDGKNVGGGDGVLFSLWRRF